MAVTLYSCLDSGAPTLNGSAGSLIALLDACLVNGYGSKSPLGWTKPFTGTNLAAYLSPAGNPRYLRVDDTNAGINSVTMYETMTAISTGTNPAPSSGSYYIPCNRAGGTNNYWELLGDSKRFYLFVYSPISNLEAMDRSLKGTNALGGIFFFGDIISYVPGDLYSTCIAAGSYYGAGYSPLAPSNSFSVTRNGLWACRSYQGSTAAIQALTAVQHSGLNNGTMLGGNSSNASIAYPGPGGEVYYTPLLLIEQVSTSYHLRGHMPGLWSPVGYFPLNHGDTVTGSGAHAGKTFRVWQTQTGTVFMETSDTWS